MSTGRYGFTGPQHIGPTGTYNALASTSFGGTAVIGVQSGPSLGEGWRFEPGYHPEQAAPYTYISLPHFDVQHHVTTIEYATFDGGMLGAGAVVAGLATGRKVRAFAENDAKLREALERIEQPPNVADD